MKLARQLQKSVAFIVVIVCYIITGLLFLITLSDESKRRKVLTANNRFFARLLLRVFNISVSCVNHSRESLQNFRGICVANHLSYIDIIALASLKKFLFVSSFEVRDSFFLGTVAQIGATFFVNRRNRSKVKQEAGKMAELISDGMTIMLFPEATSTDGSEVISFKSSLFHAATESGADVIPLTISYRHGEVERERIAWYGDKTFFPHLWMIFGMKKICLSIDIEESLSSKKSDRKELARKSHEKISRRYKAALYRSA